MARIMGIDYGTKRIGIAVTDPLQIISSALATVPAAEIFEFLEKYLKEEEVECIVVGEPTHIDGSPTKIEHLIKGFMNKLRKSYPRIELARQDERYSSKDAKEIILRSGAKKKKRREKGLVDRVSAALILEEYLESKR